MAQSIANANSGLESTHPLLSTSVRTGARIAILPRFSDTTLGPEAQNLRGKGNSQIIDVTLLACTMPTNIWKDGEVSDQD